MANRSRLPALLGLALLVALPALTSGCSEAWKQKMEEQSEQRKRTVQERILRDRALEFWELVRWQSWSQAATYLEKEEAQLAFLRRHTGAGVTHTAMDDVEIRYVFIGTENTDDAEVRVSWTEVVATEARVGERQVTQRWYKKNTRWWVDPTQPLGVDDAPAGSAEVAPDGTIDEGPPPDLPTETP